MPEHAYDPATIEPRWQKVWEERQAFRTPTDPAELAGITAEIETSVGSLKLEFLPEKAPGHVKNFVNLAKNGFYNGTRFHRVIKNFMIQTGSRQGTRAISVLPEARMA